MSTSFGVVKEGGTLVSIVGTPNDDLRKQHNLGKAGFVFVEPNGIQLAELSRLFDRGVLKASPVKEYPLAEAAKAHQESESGRVRGKLVLRIR
ncbi:zinc-binding dehydrogenase [Myxococcota bacterium]